MEKKNERLIGLDILRILCCFGIIILHETGHIYEYKNVWFVYQAIVRPCLWVFFSISGYFILKKPINNFKDYYLKRLPSLLLPFFIYAIVMSLFNNIISSNNLISGFNLTYFKLLFTGANSGHLWFIYSILGVYLVAPFLQKMLFSLSNKQLKFLLLLTMFFMCINPLLSSVNFKFEFDIIFNNIGVFYFILGYSFSKLNFKKYKTTIIVIGILNFLFLIYAQKLPFLLDNLYTTGINMIIATVFYFIIFIDIQCNNKKINSVINFISNKTFGIYIVHLLVLQMISQFSFLQHTTTNYLYMPIIKSVIIFIISLFISSIIDFLFLKPCKKTFDKIIKELNFNLKK